MRDRNHLRRIIVGSFLIIFLAPATFFVDSARQAGMIRWAVRLYPMNPDYIEVYVDATNLPTNLIVETVTFKVAFYNEQHHLIQKKSFNFLDQKLLPAIRPGKFCRYFEHSLQNVKTIEAIDLSAYGKAGGGKADTPSFQAKAEEWGSILMGKGVRIIRERKPSRVPASKRPEKGAAKTVIKEP